MKKYLKNKIDTNAKKENHLRDYEIDNKEVYFKVTDINYSGRKIYSFTFKLVNKLNEAHDFKIRVRGLQDNNFKVLDYIELGEIKAGDTLYTTAILNNPIFVGGESYLVNFYLDRDDEIGSKRGEELGEVSGYFFYEIKN